MVPDDTAIWRRLCMQREHKLTRAHSLLEWLSEHKFPNVTVRPSLRRSKSCCQVVHGRTLRTELRTALDAVPIFPANAHISQYFGLSGHFARSRFGLCCYRTADCMEAGQLGCTMELMMCSAGWHQRSVRCSQVTIRRGSWKCVT